MCNTYTYTKHAYFLKKIFLNFWLCWVFVSVGGLSLVAASGGHSSSRCAGLSLSRPLLLRSTSSRRAGSVVVAHGPSCSAACGIFPDQGSNLCPLHWQADSQPLCHQGSPTCLLLKKIINLKFLAALGLCCCIWAFSSCWERGLLFVEVCGLLIAVASLVAEHGL